MTRPRSVACATVVVLTLAACSSSGAESRPEPDDVASETRAASTVDVESTSTEPEIEDDVVSTDTVESTTSTSTTVPLARRVTEACDALAAEGFETRRTILTQPEVVEGAESECADDLQRLRDAVGVRDITAEIATEAEPVEITAVSCDAGTYRFIATNPLEVPIGVHASFRVFLGDDADPTYSGDYPIVIWELEPGASQGITGTYFEPDVAHRCSVGARVFNADGSGADAGLAQPTNPQVTGDDPVSWFGPMLDLEVRSTGSGNPDAAADIEDVRSVGYAGVLELTSGDAPIERSPIAVTVCNGTVDQPSPERMSFVYSITYPAADSSDATETFQRHGLFRRGEDGQWRWLSSPQFFSSPDFASCGPDS